MTGFISMEEGVDRVQKYLNLITEASIEAAFSLGRDDSDCVRYALNDIAQYVSAARDVLERAGVNPALIPRGGKDAV